MLSLIETLSMEKFRPVSALEKVWLIPRHAGEHYQWRHSETDFPQSDYFELDT